jgi:hypothetical protein
VLSGAYCEEVSFPIDMLILGTLRTRIWFLPGVRLNWPPTLRFVGIKPVTSAPKYSKGIGVLCRLD